MALYWTKLALVSSDSAFLFIHLSLDPYPYTNSLTPFPNYLRSDQNLRPYNRRTPLATSAVTRWHTVTTFWVGQMVRSSGKLVVVTFFRPRYICSIHFGTHTTTLSCCLCPIIYNWDRTIRESSTKRKGILLEMYVSIGLCEETLKLLGLFRLAKVGHD